MVLQQAMYMTYKKEETPISPIDPNQDYDIVQTLTFASGSGDCNIRLYRGSNSASSGTVYYRAGTSGAWTAKSVSGTSDTFPVSSTTMQVAHDWNKDGNNYMTCSFRGQSTNLKAIYISLKAVLSGVMGDNFMHAYAQGCSSLISLSVPDTSGLTTVGDFFMDSYAHSCTSLTSLSVPDTSGLTTVESSFMHTYAYGCSSLTSLSVPDTSGLTTVGDNFMSSYASSCSLLTSLSVPDTSGLTTVGGDFMVSYANNCPLLTSLSVPDTSGLTTVGDKFMTAYANNCSSLTSLSVPDTSNVSNVGNNFMSSYAFSCSSLTSLSVPDTSGLTTVGDFFMSYYAYDCTSLTSLSVPDTSGLTSVEDDFMLSYAQNCSSLTSLILPKAGRFETNNVDWNVPSGRLGILKGKVIDAGDLTDRQGLTTNGKTLHTNYIQDPNNVELLSPPQSSIDPNQDYDMVQTLKFASGSGNCKIRLYRGSTSAFSGTVYYRAGTSGVWTAKSVSGTSSTFPVSSTTMQVAHDWNKDGDNYMTCSFYGQSTNLKAIDISLKTVLSGVMGNNFMYYYAVNCTSLISLSVPNTSGLTSVGGYFMRSYAYGCSSLISLSVPDTNGFTSVGVDFMVYYATSCTSLTSLILPSAGRFETNNVDWSVPSSRLGVLKGKVIDAGDLADRQGLTTIGKTLYTNYIQDPNNVELL